MSVTTIFLIVIGVVLGLAFGAQLIFLLQRVVIALTQIALFVGLVVGLGWLWSTSQKSAGSRGPAETPVPEAPSATPEPTEFPLPPLPEPVWWKSENLESLP